MVSWAPLVRGREEAAEQQAWVHADETWCRLWCYTGLRLALTSPPRRKRGTPGLCRPTSSIMSRISPAPSWTSATSWTPRPNSVLRPAEPRCGSHGPLSQVRGTRAPLRWSYGQKSWYFPGRHLSAPGRRDHRLSGLRTAILESIVDQAASEERIRHVVRQFTNDALLG